MFALTLLSVLACIRTAASTTSSHALGVPRKDHVLKAAVKQRNLVVRSVEDDIYLAHNIELSYAEEEADFQNSVLDQGPSRLAAQLQGLSKEPILQLGSFENRIEEIECSDSGMRIVMSDEGSFARMQSVCADLDGGWVVASSHASCSEEGAHSVYSVVDHGFDDAELSINLQIQASNLQSAFSNITFNIGHNIESYSVHQHDRLLRSRNHNRDALARAPSPTSTLPSISPSPSVVKANDTVNNASLKFSEIDTTFKLPGNVSLPYDLGCRNCTGTGNLTLSTVKLEFYDPGELIEGDDDDLIESGAVQLDLKGFAMSIGLRATPELEVRSSLPLFEVQILGAQIPGVGDIGLSFALDLEFQAQLQFPVELGFGFDVEVPDTTIRADLAENQNSGITGFEPNITAQDIRTNTSELELFLLAGLRPSFPIGLSLLGRDLEVGPFLSLPNFNLNASQLPTTDESDVGNGTVVGADCEPIEDDEESLPEEFTDQYSNVTHIEYKVGLGGGILLPLSLPAVTFASTNFPLATQCLVYTSEEEAENGEIDAGLAPATQVLASITEPPASGPTGGDDGGNTGDDTSAAVGASSSSCGKLIALTVIAAAMGIDVF